MEPTIEDYRKTLEKALNSLPPEDQRAAMVAAVEQLQQAGADVALQEFQKTSPRIFSYSLTEHPIIQEMIQKALTDGYDLSDREMEDLIAALGDCLRSTHSLE